ncbi:MAG: CRTAC1 family protein [Phycisphaerales bacterium]
MKTSVLDRFSNRSSRPPAFVLGCVGGSVSLFASLAGGQTAISFIEYTSQAGLDDALRLIAPGGRYGIMSGGGVAGDFNNDGFADIFMLAGGGYADYLYINNQDGTFTDLAADWGVDYHQHSFGASAADYNNDGYLDIFVTSYGDSSEPATSGELRLFKNNGPDAQGNWSFTDVAEQAGVNRLIDTVKDGTGSAWGDYDLDGDLDLFVCGYNELRVCNRVFRNDGPNAQGEYTFTDITDETGIAQEGIRGFLPQLVDMNDDLYPELIVIADSGTAKYFINNQDGTFTDMTDTARGIETINGMGLDVGDINNDGLLDIYATSITYPSTDGPGNVMLIQNEDGSFDDTAHDDDNGTYSGYWGWGPLIVDLDHDGDRDIVETNGFVGEFAGDPAVIFENVDGGVVFNEIAQQAGFVQTGQGRGMVRLDIENDGDLDIVVFESNTRMRLFRNELITSTTPADRHWIRVQLDTADRDALAPDGIGAMVCVTTNDTTQLMPMHSGSNHCSASVIEVHAGVGDASMIDAVQIHWPDGSYQTLTDVPADQVLHVDAWSSPADYTNDGIVSVMDIMSFLDHYTKNDLIADHNGDMVLNFFDVSKFISDYRQALMP